MRHFTVTTAGLNKLGLRELCDRYCNERWFADHMTAEQAAESFLDEFKRAVKAELELLSVECWEGNPVDAKSDA